MNDKTLQRLHYLWVRSAMTCCSVYWYYRIGREFWPIYSQIILKFYSRNINVIERHISYTGYFFFSCWSSQAPSHRLNSLRDGYLICPKDFLKSQACRVAPGMPYPGGNQVLIHFCHVLPVSWSWEESGAEEFRMDWMTDTSKMSDHRHNLCFTFVPGDFRAFLSPCQL